MEKIINIGIFAHVDAGKTTVTEELLYSSGAIKTLGRVDHGDTVTDSMTQERERGITIQAQPVSFQINDLKVNLIDTPGHVDFVAEVERSMDLLDGAILVLSGKEGVQAHTYLLFNSLKKLNIPFIIFINKIDRLGCDPYMVVEDIKKELTQGVIPLQDCIYGGKDASVTPLFKRDFSSCVELLADYDSDIMDNYINDRLIENSEIINSIKSLSTAGIVHPVLFGSALSGVGIKDLIDGITMLLPYNSSTQSEESSFKVFKVKRDSKDFKQYYIKVLKGKLSLKDSVNGKKISKIERLYKSRAIQCKELERNDIGIIYGVDLRVGDIIGDSSNKTISMGTPTLKAGVKPIDPLLERNLIKGIDRIAESDPFLEYEKSLDSKEIYLNFFGKVQMDIVRDILLNDHQVEVEFLEPGIIYRESPIGVGEALIDMSELDNPYNVTLGLRVEPGDVGSGVTIKTNLRTGDLPAMMWHGIEDGIRSSLGEGLYGWEVEDIIITITKTGIIPVSTPAEFRDMAPMVLHTALYKSETRLKWPLMEFRLKVQEEFYGRAVSDLLKMKGEFSDPVVKSGRVFIEGVIPLETSQHYQLELTDYTGGKGSISSSFLKFAPVTKEVYKCKKRLYPDPLDRALYIMNKRGRV